MRGFYDPVGVDRWLSCLHEDAELHELAEIPDSKVYRGHDEIRAWLEHAQEIVSGWEWTPEEVLAEGDDVVVLKVRLTAAGRSSGVPIDQVVFHVIDVRGDRIARVRGFLQRDRALAAAGMEAR